MAARAKPKAPTGSIDKLLAAKEIVTHCGSGAHANATMAAAAAALADGHPGGSVLVRHVPPANRPPRQPQPPPHR